MMGCIGANTNKGKEKSLIFPIESETHFSLSLFLEHLLKKTCNLSASLKDM